MDITRTLLYTKTAYSTYKNVSYGDLGVKEKYLTKNSKNPQTKDVNLVTRTGALSCFVSNNS